MGSALSLVRGTVAGLTALLVTLGFVVALTPRANAAPGCRVTYAENAWNSGLTTAITITNTGGAWTSWQLRYSYGGTERLVSGWGGRWSQSGQDITVDNASWNANVGTNRSITIGAHFGFTGGRAAPPSAFSVNGVTCNGTNPTPTGNPGTRLDNPYEGAKVYVNPDWSARAAAEPGGSRVADLPTFVWMDRRAAITGTTGARGLRAHLDTALTQGAQVFQLVLYNLPGRDCARLNSSRELGPQDLAIYKTEFIDPIAAILSDPKYASLRIVTVVEPGGLPDLINNVSPRPSATIGCDTLKATGAYIGGVGYALAKLGAIPNVYNYLDAGYHGTLGWEDNFIPAMDLIKAAATAEGSTTANVHGFIVNTASYGALTEPYFSITDTINGVSVRQSKWVDWNNYIDQQTFARAWRDKAATSGFDPAIGMLIDTSRNGWGGPTRPTGPGPRVTLDEYVNRSRLDRRISTGNWCNQSGAGLGERPQPVGTGGIDAYVWAKPPGESDGSDGTDRNSYEPMCDPTYTGRPGGSSGTLSGALPGSPPQGQWFPAQFQQLMQNAYPPLN